MTCYPGIPYDKKWFVYQTLTKEDWYDGHLQSITKEEAKKYSSLLNRKRLKVYRVRKIFTHLPDILSHQR